MKLTKTTFILCFLLVLGFTANLQSQSTARVIEAKVETTYAEFLGTTLPLRDIVPAPPTDPDKRRQSKLMKKPPRNFIGRGKNTVLRPDLEHRGPDPVWQKELGGEKAIPVEPLVNVDGLFDDFGSPHDPTGDVGQDHYLQAINATTLGVFDKSGALLNSFAANTIWSSIGFASAGDPIVLYDQEANRWLITEFPSNNRLLVAISATSDPMSSYKAWSFSTPSFPDYPKYGIWSNAYSVTTNEGGPGTLHAYFINRQAILDGAATVSIQRISLPGNLGTEAGFFVATPVDWSGLTPPDTDPIILALNDSSWGDTPQDAIEVYSVDIDWAVPGNTAVTNTTVVTAPYDSYACAAPGFGFQCVPQPGGGGLDGIPETIMHQAHYRNFGSHESMVMNFMTDVDGDELSGIRWIEMRRTPGSDWAVHQEGTFAPNDGLHRFMGSIAMDGAGNIGLGYNVSSATTFVGVRFTGRRASDPLGVMTVDEYNVVDGANTINSFGRFGDYAHMSIDPTNDRTFWYTTEYAKSGSSRTRIVAFELKRDTTDIGPVALRKPISADNLSNSEPVQIEVKNFGLDTPSVFQVGYILENNQPVVETVNFTLHPDSTYIHDFPQTVDMSVIGNYAFRVFTVLPGDQAVFNDTLRQIVSKLPRWDAGISSITGPAGTICGSEAEVVLRLTNFGTQPLISAVIDVEITLGGSFSTTINWSGNLDPGASENITVVVTGLANGNNQLSARASLPNGFPDENPVNDANARTVAALTNGVDVTLLLTTDEYPGETTWTLSDENGQVLYAGGPYDEEEELFTHVWCLDPEACYEFQIFDSYGDGICCGFGKGSIAIVDADGNPLANNTGEFGFEETIDFCATFVCLLEVDIDISPESIAGAGDGAILLTPSNGVGPFQYSIDGGATFQPANLFANLPAGDYQIVVTGEAECLFEETVTLVACTLDFTATVQPASTVNTNDGRITIQAGNGTPPFQYSINGGNSFQNSNVFNNLGDGVYNLVVVDANGCETTGEALVDIINSDSEVQFGLSIQVFPSPTSGVFTMNVKGLQHHSVFLKYGLHDATGKLLYESTLARYDQTYTGQATLHAFPSGVYYIRFLDSDLNRLVRVLKE